MAKRRRMKKPYRFTPKRKNALKKAQLASARKRRILIRDNARKVGKGSAYGAAGAVTAMGLTVVGAGVVFGGVVKRNNYYNNRAEALYKGGEAARKVTAPGQKEAVRMASAISPANTPRGGVDAPTYQEILADKALKRRNNRPGPRPPKDPTKEQMDALNEEAGVPKSGLGRNNGAPGRSHSGGGVRWGDGGAVGPEVRRIALEMGHDGDGEQVLRSEGIIEKSLPRKLLKGKKVGKNTIDRALKQRRNALAGNSGNVKGQKGKSGKWTQSHLLDKKGNTDQTLLDMMVAEGEIMANIHGFKYDDD